MLATAPFMHRSHAFPYRLTVFLLAASLFGVLGALYHYAQGLPVYWKLPVLQDFLGWMAACAGLSWLLRRSAGSHAPRLFALALLAYLAVGAGIAASAAVALLFLCAFLCGQALLARISGSTPGWSASLLAGLVPVLAASGLMIHFPVNYRPLYLGLLLVPVLALMLSGNPARTWRALADGILARSRVLDAIPYWQFVLLAGLTAALARYALYPTVGYDENALHLRLWTQLAYRHVYSFDVLSHVWETAPFTVDLLHAVASLVAGEDARAALNLGFLLLLFVQLWAIFGKSALAPRDRLLLLFLLASTPMLCLLLDTLQAELFLALLAAAGVRLALEADGRWIGNPSLAVLAIAALCVATKAPGGLLGVLLLAAAALQIAFARARACAAARGPERRGNALVLMLFVIAAAAVALHSYLVAWKITGNPLFPLYNGIFRSPYFPPVNFADTRWLRGFSLYSYWAAFFHTSGYLEAKDFVAGFQYLFLPWLALALAGRAQGSRLWIVLLPLAGFGAAMFAMTQYWRYIFPVFPLATVAIGWLLAARQDSGAWSGWIARSVLFLYAALNLCFLPGISWVFEIPPQRAYTEAGRKLIADAINPARQITAYLNERYKGTTVLYPASAPFGATLRGRPIYVNWYAPAQAARLAGARSVADIAQYVKDEKVEFVVWSTFDAFKPENPEWLLREYLSRQAYPELRIGDMTLYRVVGRPLDYRAVFALSGQAAADGKRVSEDAPGVLATIPLAGATIARFQAALDCPAPKGRLVFQIDWDAGPTYYRLVPCDAKDSGFSESLPVPAGATRAEIRIGRQDAGEILLKNLTLETN